MQRKEAKMDVAFRATQAGFAEGHKAGFAEGFTEGYTAGYDAAWAPSTADLWSGVVDEVLDRLTRHFDATLPDVAAALRAVCVDYNHPSRVWDAPRGGQ